MSKIALIIEELGKNRAACLMHLKRLSGIGFPELEQRIGDGDPVLVQEIFARDHPTFAADLKQTLVALHAAGCRWAAFELLDDERWNAGATYYQVTIDRLTSMIESHARGSREQRRFGQLEEGDSGSAPR